MLNKSKPSSLLSLSSAPFKVLMLYVIVILHVADLMVLLRSETVPDAIRDAMSLVQDSVDLDFPVVVEEYNLH